MEQNSKNILQLYQQESNKKLLKRFSKKIKFIASMCLNDSNKLQNLDKVLDEFYMKCM